MPSATNILSVVGVLVSLAAAASAKLAEEAVPYRHGDVALTGFVVYDDAAEGKRPAVIVVHEWWGLNDFAKQRAREVAKSGYVAFAIDMYGDVASDVPGAVALVRPFRDDPRLFRERARAGFDVVAKHARVDASRIGAIGFCFGGSTVQHMAFAGLPLKGVVSFHGGLETPTAEDLARTKASLLILHGAADTTVPAEELHGFVGALMHSALDWQLVTFSGAKHAFTNPAADQLNMPGIGYDKRTHHRAWQYMQDFFAELFAKESD